MRPAALGALLLAGLLGCGEPPAEGGPGAGPGEPAWFVEEATARGLDFRHDSGHEERFLYPEIIGGGGALFDLDGDGDLDAYLVQSGSLVRPGENAGNRLFANDGAGRFADVTAGSGADDPGYGMGAAVGDADGDGDLDLYVTNLARNALLANEGGGRFADVTAASGTGEELWSSSAAFFDGDRDGDLDLFCVNYLFWSLGVERVCYVQPLGETYCGPKAYDNPSPDTLYRNEGDGRFTNVSGPAGLLQAFGNGLGVAASDFDLDGRQDVFVANDGNLDQLWVNRTEEGGELAFVDQGVAFGCGADQDGRIKAGMGVGVLDLDDDRDEDLLVVNLDGEPDSLFVNQRTHFVDRTAASGVRATSQAFTRFGVGFVDFDNDGRADVYLANGRVALRAESWAEDPLAEPNLLFRGVGGLRFEEVLPRGGTRELLVATSRAAVFGDVDGDGGVDVLVVNKDAPAHLLLNRVPGRGSWVRFRVVERGGADAIGATVTLRVGERELFRVVRSASSYLAASDPAVHVGLGTAGGVEDVRVAWPDGLVEDFGARAAGRTWTLERGRGAR